MPGLFDSIFLNSKQEMAENTNYFVFGQAL